MENENKTIIRNCVCCGAEIEQLYDLPEHKPWENMWSDGTVTKIDVGFGSNYDGSIIELSICDNCIKEKLSSGALKIVGNYLSNLK